MLSLLPLSAVPDGHEAIRLAHLLFHALLAHRRAVRGRKDKARQNRISLLLALVVAADLWRCHYNIVWWQNNQLEADYAANPLGLYVDALFVLFALLNLAAVTLPRWDVFVRGRRPESAMPSASRREPV